MSPHTLLLIVDLETTGLDPQKDLVIELGAILYSVNHRCSLQHLSTLFPVSENKAELVNHISSQASQEVQNIELVLQQFQYWVEQADFLIAHNARFDSQWFGHGILPPINKPWLCTYQDFVWEKNHKPTNLIETALNHGIGVSQAHRALTDCQLIAAIFDRVGSEFKQFEILLDKAIKRSREPLITVIAKFIEARRAIEQGEVMGATNPKTGKPFSYQEILELPPEEKAKMKKLDELESDIGLEFDRGYGGYGVPNFYFIGPDRLPSNLVKRRRLGTLGVDVPSLRSLGGAGLAAAGAITGSALTQGAEAMTDVLGAYGAPPTPKDRMQIEKSFNSDTGLGFDLSPEGELEANPAGFKAVRQRQNRGINFPTMVRGQQQ